MQKKIIRREYSEQCADSLSDCHPILQRVYAARRIETQHALDRSLERLLPASSLLGIDQAVALLAEALSKQEKILIVGDFDADGATSTALAIRALKSFGARSLQFLVPNRFAYGYGLTPELVALAQQSQPDLIVTVDNGIANHAGVEAAIAAGIRVLITDHHLPAATLPPAHAIVNPNQPNDLFPSKCLAGVGVIFYVMLALRRYLKSQAWFEKRCIPEPNMTSFLDLVALGTVADLVPLDHNNRILVYQGLRRIRAGQCIPAIVALLELSSRDFKEAQASDLGFAVAARLNAAGRMDDMSLGIECLLSDDAMQARKIASQLNGLNLERRQIEQDMQAQALTVLDQFEPLQGELPRGLCLFDQSWHQGVIGILASRIKEKFNRPVIIFAPGHADEIKGSARSISGLHIRDILALIDAQHPGLIQKFGGHAMAAGLSLRPEVFGEFKSIFEKTIAQHLTEAELQHCLFSDGELSREDFSLEVATLLRDAGPWGQAFPEPHFDDQFRILEQRIVGDKHLKLTLAKDEKILDAIAFFVDTAKWPNHRAKTLHAVYRLDVNEYKGRRNVQLILDYLEAV